MLLPWSAALPNACAIWLAIRLFPLLNEPKRSCPSYETGYEHESADADCLRRVYSRLRRCKRDRGPLCLVTQVLRSAAVAPGTDVGRRMGMRTEMRCGGVCWQGTVGLGMCSQNQALWAKERRTRNSARGLAMEWCALKSLRTCGRSIKHLIEFLKNCS